MPKTWSWLATLNPPLVLPGESPFDPASSIKVAGRFMKWLMDRPYIENQIQATAAYNMGQGNLQKVVSGKMKLPDETKEYLKVIMENTIKLKRSRPEMMRRGK